MNFRKFCFSFFVLSLFGIALFGQSGTSVADKLFEEEKYDKAVKAYEKMLEKGESFAFERLADCFRMTGEFQKAELWYKKAIEKGDVDPEVHLNHAKMLQNNGKYQAAIDEYLLYGKLSSAAKEGNVATNGDPNGENSNNGEVGDDVVMGDTPPVTTPPKEDPRFIKRGSDKEDDSEDRGTMILPKYRVQTVSGINTGYSDYLTGLSGSTVLFSSRENKEEGKKGKKDKKRTTDFNFYTATRSNPTQITKVIKAKGKANSKSDDFWAVYAPGREIVYFSRSEMNGANGDQGKINTYSSLINKKGKWKKVRELPFEVEGGNINAYPAIHPTGNLLILASDRPGGYGGMDLWISRKEGDIWGEPMNLGPDINTAGNESYPTINNQGVLFFSSDGHGGFGGLDIFSSQWRQNKWQDISNLGYGINSPDNDFGVIWEPGKSEGYFMSDRSGGSGDDVFHFVRAMEVMGTITEVGSTRPVVDAHVVFTDTKGEKSEAYTNDAGEFAIYSQPNTAYKLTITAEGYKSYEKDFTTSGVRQGEDMERDFELEINRMYTLEGSLLDPDSGRALTNVTVHIMNDGNIEDRMVKTDASGRYKFSIKNNDEFDVIYKRDEYVPTIVRLSLDEFNGYERDSLILPMKRGDYLMVTGKVSAADGKKKPLTDAILHVINNRTQTVVDSGFTSKYGVFRFALPWDSLDSYSFIASKKGYLSTSIHVDARYDKEINVDMELEDANYGLASVLKTIYYDYNQTLLELVSKKDLNEIFYFLLANPEAKLEVRSHTDSRGTKTYNRVLSFKRSESVIEFIRERKELPVDRFISRGFGEEMLINDCDDSNVCGEEDHANNRRTEIFILDH